MAGSSSQGIFLSYRREDAAPYARLLKSELRERLPHARVFMDLDSIKPGQDFTEVIRGAVDSCAVLVALVGRQWATLTDEEGRRRVDHPDDCVRFEVRAALKRGVLVIPVLVDGAKPLRQHELPSDLSKLARLHALELSIDRYQYDADRLLGVAPRRSRRKGITLSNGEGQEERAQTRPIVRSGCRPWQVGSLLIGRGNSCSVLCAEAAPGRGSAAVPGSERSGG